VARVRKLSHQRRVGHAGTLDPLASGVLPVLLGRATRLMDLVQSGRKTYVTTVSLGSATETDDAEGAITATAPVPRLSAAALHAALAAFQGEILQTPPAYSALKVNGQRAYDLARRGAAVTLAPRSVTIDALFLLDFTPDTLTLEVTCSKGTYIRALARDIAQALGTVGHMSALRRTRVGPFTLERACTLDELADIGVESACLPASAAESDSAAPAVTVSPADAHRLSNGQALSTLLRAERVWVYDPSVRLLCLATADGVHLKPLIQL
jgi:tRNA pseudouridine55 synthase